MPCMLAEMLPVFFRTRISEDPEVTGSGDLKSGSGQSDNQRKGLRGKAVLAALEISQTEISVTISEQDKAEDRSSAVWEA